MNLPDRVTFLREEQVPDGGGGFSTEWVVQDTVDGRFGVIGASEIEVAVQSGESVTVSLRVPHGTDVKRADRVEVTGHPAVEDATYEVDTIRPNRDHLRLMCSTATT